MLNKVVNCFQPLFHTQEMWLISVLLALTFRLLWGPAEKLRPPCAAEALPEWMSGQAAAPWGPVAKQPLGKELPDGNDRNGQIF